MKMDFEIGVAVVDDHLAILVGSKIINDIQSAEGDSFTVHYSDVSKRSIEKDAAYALNINPQMVHRLLAEKPTKHNGSKEYVDFKQSQEQLFSALMSSFETLSITMPKAGYGLNYHIRILSQGDWSTTLTNTLGPKLESFQTAKEAYLSSK